MLNTLITIGPGALFLALVLAVVYALLGRIPRDNEGKARVGRYFFGVGVAGAVAYVAGAVVGVTAFCAPANAGNLCGLGGIFGLGPLLAGAAIVIYTHLQTRNASNAP